MTKMIFKGLALALSMTSVSFAYNPDQAMQKALNEEINPVQPAIIYGQIAQIFAEGVSQTHFSHRFMDDEIAVKALENYLNTLDYDHSIFLASDISKFKEQATYLDDLLRRGQVQFAYDVFLIYKQRLQNRIAYTDTLLQGKFNFQLEESYLWDRDKAPWAADQQEWDNLWRKKIKHELLGLKVNALMREDPVSSEQSKDQKIDKSSSLTPEENIHKKYVQVWNVINSHDTEWVLQMYLTAFAQSYDTHSSYLSPRVNEDFDIDMKLSLTGIGALLNLEDGAAQVVRLIPGGPADLDGRLKAGDKIVAVGQKNEEPVDILYWPLYKSVRLIRGEKGSTVSLNVIPASDVTGTTIQKIDLVRDKIKLENRAAKLAFKTIKDPADGISKKIAVITLPEFYTDFEGKRRGDTDYRSASLDVKKLLQQVRTEKVDGLILDLRNNGGGSLEEAIEMTGYFIDSGPVVQIKGGNRVNILNDPYPSREYNGPMLVLVNRMSASASEILAGALQDYGRALIVGDSKTHGKGTVQALFPLDRRNESLGALKITTANFYRVNGDSTQLKGVTPDIVIHSALDAMEIGEEYLPNVLEWSTIKSTDFSHSDEILTYKNQLTDKSHLRLNSDERYKRYQELIKRIEKRNSTKSSSLRLNDRLALANQDKELEKILKQISEMGSSENTTDDSATPNGENNIATANTDIILDESLMIMNDLIDLTQTNPHIIAGHPTSQLKTPLETNK